MLLKLREETSRHTKQNALALENTKQVDQELHYKTKLVHKKDEELKK